MKIQHGHDLSHVYARDLVRGKPVTLSPEDTIESALETFEDLRIGGAPVVDSGGRLVGVLTLSDVARTEHIGDDRMQTRPGTFEMAADEGESSEPEPDMEQVFFAKEDYSPEVRGRELVSDWMARDAISVRPEASLTEVCETMVDQGVHRVFVTEGQRLLGVVSSFDVVRCVARGVPPRRARG